MDISTVTDINTLKVMKADAYDLLEVHSQGVERARADIQTINTRIKQITEPADPKAPEDAGSTTTTTTAAPVENLSDKTEIPVENAGS